MRGAFLSQAHSEPDITLEIFFLDRDSVRCARDTPAMNQPMTAEQRRHADAVFRIERERADLILRAREEPAAGMTHAEKTVRLARAAASLRA